MATPARSMRILGAAFAALVTVALPASAQQAVIVVRHAEKADQTPDTALSAAGRARAKALADLLRGAGVTHIITSEYLRSRDTAAPLADALGLKIEQVPARDFAALAARLKALDPAAIVLVVGHSNTVPPMLAALGWPNKIDLGDGDYDNVFVLTPRPGQPASMVRLKYGQPSS
jgi:phosphohistidine phosphatase SixA